MLRASLILRSRRTGLTEQKEGDQRDGTRQDSFLSELTDEAIGQLGRAATDTLTKMRGCTSGVVEMQPHFMDSDAAAAEFTGNRMN